MDVGNVEGQVWVGKKVDVGVSEGPGSWVGRSDTGLERSAFFT